MKFPKQFSVQDSWTARQVWNLFVEVAEAVGLREDRQVQQAAGMLAAKQYKSFLTLTDSWASQQYGSAAEHAAWNQLACLLKKYPFDDPSIDRKATALEKFRLAETRCHRVNQRFKAYQNREKRIANLENHSGKPLPYHALIHRARTWIVDVIGSEPPVVSIVGKSGLSPGTAIGKTGDLTHFAAKLDAKVWPVTPKAVPYAIAALVGDDHIRHHLMYGAGLHVGIWPEDELRNGSREYIRVLIQQRLQLVHHNKIELVPKTALSDRTIAKEPLLNGYLQKGADLVLRDMLRRVGLDLGNQTANQLMAQAGSDMLRYTPYCTIDLSAASDSLAIELVRLLLPPAWFELLDNLRSPEYLLPGEDFTRRYEKFTSMGNGFCFPLETLIFASVVVAAYDVTGDKVRNNYRVYGDDIIVRQSAALLVLEVLRYFGFRANVDKTFIHGPFRESCGADFFDGVNVRPYYLDKVPTTIGDLFGILNGLSQKGFAAERCWESVFNLIPRDWQFCRPHAGPDTAITVERDRFMACKYAKWNVDEQRWSWMELLPQAVLDEQVYNPALEMYGAVRGADALIPHGDTRIRERYGQRAYLPAYAYRRKTRTLQRRN